jgi:hypothetical protein
MASVSHQIVARGTPRPPQSPRDLQIQRANGGAYATWKLPADHSNVAGWRVYVNSESNLAAQIRDKGTRQIFVPLGSDSSPKNVNVMVSAFTTLGRESGKIIKQSAPLSQTASTNVPSAPPGYLNEAAGGSDRSLVRFNGQQQYVPLGAG